METRGGLTPLPFKTVGEVGCAIRDDRYQSSADVPINATLVPDKGEGITTEENIQIADENEGTALIYSAPVDPSFCDDYTINNELGDYLTRPVLINTTSWTLGTPFNLEIFPWDLYFNDDRIRKKLDNYSLLNCTLNIKIVVNASPFYYGLALAAYKPLDGFKDETIKNVATYDDDLVPLSQRPHIYIYPQSCQGGHLKLPFFYYKNWLRVNDRQVFQWMGKLTIREIFPLSNANSVVGTDVNIQIYAWASDVKLTAPTNALALQSGDEYMYTGPVSAPASAIAAITGKLEDVPVIGPFMTATRALSSGVSKFAAYFGFTNTQVIDDVKPFKDLPFHSLASSEIGQPTEKLTLDPKNELSIDPRIVGLTGHDELSIKDFIMRESYLTQEVWSAADTVDTILFSSRIMPMLNKVNGVYRQMTPLAYSQFLFRYWRGDICFRIRFICSKYHRGRARITWDPEGNIITDAVTSTTSFTRIVDISEETDVEICVPYMQATPWLLTDNSSNFEFFGKSYVTTRFPNSDNGTLCVRVFTEQSSPVASADIGVVVSVRGCENFEYAAPKELPSDMSFWDLQSSDIMSYDGGNLCNITQNSVGKKHSHRFLVNMGEKISSFRQLLRRSSLSRVLTSRGVGTGDDFAILKTLMSPYPLYNGYDPNGINDAKGTLVPGSLFPYNYSHNIPFNWIGNCFIGMRGSSTWHVNCDSKNLAGTLRWRRSNDSRSTASYYGINWLATSSSEDVADHYFTVNTTPGSTGQSLTHQITQAGSSVTVPMYNHNRMISTDVVKRNLGNSIDGTDGESVEFSTLIRPNSDTATGDLQTYSLYHNIGTDFNFYFFLNCPTVVVSPVPNPTV